MPSSSTSKYKLSQWVRTDEVLMDDFNKDNEKIDTALAKKAEQSELMFLQSTVSQKAEKSALDGLKETVTSHAAALAGKGNCTIHTQSYTGTGSHSYSNPRKLTFPGRPVIVFIADRSHDGTALTAIYGQTYVLNHAISPAAVFISWGEKTMSWHSAGNDASQLDQTGFDYDVVALIAES